MQRHHPPRLPEKAERTDVQSATKLPAKLGAKQIGLGLYWTDSTFRSDLVRWADHFDRIVDAPGTSYRPGGNHMSHLWRVFHTEDRRILAVAIAEPEIPWSVGGCA
jgi:hypothetical protein